MQVRGIVSRVSPESLAQKIGISPEDEILSINNRPLLDTIDYLYFSSLLRFNIRWRRQGRELSATVRKDPGESLGLDFQEELFDGVRSCSNRCIFCFIDQMPTGLRKSLYVKDEDYRLSFLHGNFVTLTTLDEEDLRRIKRLKLSPLYVSVHATNPSVRRRMLGAGGAGDILSRLSALAASGIQAHTQIVLCPGINDGDELGRTISELASLFPSVASIGIVPVGLTKWREGLFPLTPVTADLAEKTLKMVRSFQRKFLKEKGSRLVFAADELYLLAGKGLPGRLACEDFPQLENGIGLARRFTDAFRRLIPRLPARAGKPVRAILATGILAEPLLKPFVERLNRVEGLSVSLVAVRNRLFGDSVTVAGLLPGESILKAVGREIKADLLIIPRVALKEEKIFLDDLTMEALSERLGVRVVSAGTPGEVVNLLL